MSLIVDFFLRDRLSPRPPRPFSAFSAVKSFFPAVRNTPRESAPNKFSIVAGHYCAFDGLQNDVAFKSLRGTAEFNQLIASAQQCKADFMAQRSQAR